jgi:hypothetical protein
VRSGAGAGGGRERQKGGEDDPPRGPTQTLLGASGRGKRGAFNLAGAKRRVTADTPLDTLFR